MPFLESGPSYPSRVGSVAGSSLKEDAIAWMSPTPASTPIEEMRRRFRENGYLYVKGVLPREDVLDIREHYFSYLSVDGMLKPGTSPRDGIANPDIDPRAYCGIGSGMVPKDSAAAERLVKVHSTPEFLKFFDHPKLREFVRNFMGWNKEVLMKRTLLRHSVPGAPSTGVHYDKIFLRDTESEFLTAWVPLGDIASDGGGLVYLENSDSIGRVIEDEFTERARDFTHAERIFAYNKNMTAQGTLSDDLDEWQRSHAGGRKWLISDYEAGDIVFHEPYVVHGASMNQSREGRIRLSTDIRFSDAEGDIDERWMKAWDPNDRL